MEKYAQKQAKLAEKAVEAEKKKDDGAAPAAAAAAAPPKKAAKANEDDLLVDSTVKGEKKGKAVHAR